MEVQGKCKHFHARKIAGMLSLGGYMHGVRAVVRDRQAIVSIGEWTPVTPMDPQNEGYFLRARLVRDVSADREAESTPKAHDELQSAINQVQWELWPDEN
jgi:hypothetical protein